MNKKSRQCFVFASLILTSASLFVGAILTSHTTSANDTHVDDVSIIVPISCNLNSTNTTHSKTVNPNTTEEDIGKTTLQAFCNDNNGFAIYAIGYTGDVDGTTTLVGNNTSQTISTSTNTSSSSSWSMKVTKETSSSIAYLPANMTINNGYDSYSVVPTNWTKVATFSSATDTEEPNGKGAVLYTTYKVHIAPGQAADVYSGKVKYTLFHPSTSCLYYTIKFNPGDGSGYMNDQPICNNGSTALSTNTFIPPSGGYEFKEWNTEPDGTGTSYSNGQIINTNLANIGESITLYAVWWQKNIANSEYLQEVKTCPSSLTTGQVYTLKDSRDEEQYPVAKLADGNCWMLDNLMLDPTDSTTAAKINPTNTNADSTSLDCLLGHTTGCTSPYTTQAVAVSAGATARAFIINDYKNNTVTSYGSSSGKIGVYYNFCAASAGSYCYSGTDRANTLYDIDGDLCPSGWHIPTGGNSGQYLALYAAYSSAASSVFNALSVSLSGAVNPDWGGIGTPQYRNDSGYYWSSTFSSPDRIVYARAYSSISLFFDNRSDETINDMSIPIRCVFGPTTGL